MSSRNLEALSDAELRARYQEVLGKPAPKGPSVTSKILINAINSASKFVNKH